MEPLDAPAWNDPDGAQVAAALQAADKLVLLAHVRPDGDAIGSLLAMRRALESLGKDVVVVHQEGRPASFAWLERGDWLEALPDDLAERTALVLDTSSADRVAAPGFEGARDVLVIDHHRTNTAFGRLNWVQPDAAAVGEMLPELVDRLGVALDPELAACLYTAVYTDTGRLRYSNVTERTHAVVSRLQAALPNGGRDVEAAITDWPPSWRAYATLGLERARHDGDVVISELTLKDLEAAGVPTENAKDAQTIAIDLLQDVHARFYVQLYQQPDGVRSASLRCPDQSVDAGAVAKRLGGGGHRAAAGLTFNGDPTEILSSILAEYRQERDRDHGLEPGPTMAL